MIDSKLEEQIANVERFIEDWKKLDEIVSTDEKERGVSNKELLRLQEEIALLHGSLMEELRIEEGRALEYLNGLGESFQGAQLRRRQDSWQSCLMRMNEVLGRLKERRSQLAAISRFQVARSTLFSNPFTRLVVLFICILLLYYIFKTFVIRVEHLEEGATMTIERAL